MKKSILGSMLLSVVLLASCNSNNISNSTSDNAFEGYEKDDSILEKTEVTIGVNESVYLPVLFKQEFQSSWLDIYIEDRSIAKFSADSTILGLKEGTTKASIVVDDTYVDEVTITVTADNTLTGDFKTAKEYLYGKSFTVLGDSISDVTVTAYSANRPTFWCEQLVSNLNMTMYNHAISGSTASHSQGLLNNGAPEYNVGTSIITLRNGQHSTVKEDITNSDYCFIYYGNNDYSYKVPIGEINDINDENLTTKESFKGSMGYIIDKVREYNPTIKIVLLSLSYSTWGWDLFPKNPTTNQGYAQTREELSQVVNDIATVKNCKFIDIFNLWNPSNWSTFVPDGIHPQTVGYDLIVEKILNS